MRGSLSFAVFAACALVGAAAQNVFAFPESNFHCIGAVDHVGNLPGPPATQPTICCQKHGPDVIVGDIVSLTWNNASENVGGVGYDSFSFGTTSCNVGNMNIRWDAFSSTTHPAIGQGLYKYKTVNGSARLEQIGMSWLKHGFQALADNICGCSCNGDQFEILGVGCADPYTAQRNGSQGSLKPRWYVNAHTGVFPSTQAVASGSGNTYRRCRVKTGDLEVSSAAVRYFVECQYVTQDDAYFNNNDNNASYREASMVGGSGNPANFDVGMLGTTQREQPGVRAWKDIDNQVIETDVQVAEAAPTSNGNQTAACARPDFFNGPCPPSANTSSLVIVASRATLLSGTTWHYEYAVENVNCDSSIASFSVPLPSGVTLTNIGFHDVDYHSGDGVNNVNYDGTDWAAVQSSNAIKWSVQVVTANQNDNALRYGTTYNFRFDADRPPSRTIAGGGNTVATMTTYKLAGSVTGLIVAPDNDCNSNGVGDGIDLFNGTLHDANANGVPDECEPPTPCPADIASPANHYVNVDDLLVVINGWGACPAPCPRYCGADIDHNCFVNVDDLLIVINAWGPCP